MDAVKTIMTLLAGLGIGWAAAAKPLDPDYCKGWSYGAAGAAAMQQPGAPDDEEPPSGACDVCGGDGRVGDGRVSVECQECGGDGVLGKPLAQEQPASNQDVCTCTGGGCADFGCVAGCSCGLDKVESQTVSSKPVTVSQRVISSQVCGPNGCSTSSYTVRPVRRFLFGR